jgi:DNA-binding response OmpR family regulator
MHGKRVLIVDDDPDQLQLLKLLLDLQGAQVYLATNAKDALCQFDAQRPDLLLLDIMLPETDGWQICREIRRQSDVPIIMLSGISRPRDEERALDYGIQHYMTKPFRIDALLDRVRDVLIPANACVRG